MSVARRIGLATPDAVASVSLWAAQFEALGSAVTPLAIEREGTVPDLDAIVFVIDAATAANPTALEPSLMAITAQINQLHESWHARRPGEVRVPVVVLLATDGDVARLGPLIGRSVAYLRTRGLEELIEGVCGQRHVAAHATTLRPLLQRLSMLLDFLMTLEIDFQIVCSERAQADVEPVVGVRQLLDWMSFTLERARALARVSRLRAQFVVVAVTTLVLLSVPFLLDGARVREALPTEFERGVSPLAIGHSLELDATARPVQWLDALALPGTAAQSTARRSSRLLAAWRAHSFVRERVGRAPTPDSLRVWSEKLAAGTPAGQELFVGWRTLPARDREQVQEAVRAAVLRHDLVVAAEVERLVLGRSLRSGVDASDPLRACERLSASFVLPVDADPEVRSLRARLQRRCEVLGLAPADRAAVLAVDRWREQVEEAFAAGAVTPARLADWIARTPELRARTGPGPAFARRQQELRALTDQLAQTRAALDAQRAGDVPGFTSLLEGLRSVPRHGVLAIETWARQRLAEANSTASG